MNVHSQMSQSAVVFKSTLGVTHLKSLSQWSGLLQSTVTDIPLLLSLMPFMWVVSLSCSLFNASQM